LLVFCARYPQQLAGQVPLQEISAGVYDCEGWGIRIRLIVGHQLPQTEQNVICHLFSALKSQVAFAAEHYRPRSPRSSTVIYELLNQYRAEGLPMPSGQQVLEEFVREARERLLKEMTPEERLQGLRPEDILKLLPREEIERYLRKTNGQSPAPDTNGGQAKGP
jgi:hypothetical protein